jgi:hypothetical protein
MAANSKAEDLYQMMCQARREWEAASHTLKQAMELFCDVGGNSDGITSVESRVQT